MAENKCPKCSSLMPDGFRFCTACGSPMFVAAPAAPVEEPVPAAAPVEPAAPAAAETVVPAVEEPEEQPVVIIPPTVTEEVESIAAFAEELVGGGEPAPAEQSVELPVEEPVVEAPAQPAEVETPVVEEYIPAPVVEEAAAPVYETSAWQDQYVPAQPAYEAPAAPVETPAAPVEAPAVPAPVETPVAETKEPAKKLTGKEKRAAKRLANQNAAEAVKGTKYEPVKAWGYVGTYILMGIPVLNVLLLIIWALGGCHKIGRRNWARAQFLMFLLSVVFTALIIGGLFLTLQALGLDFKALAEGDFTQLEQLTEYLVYEYLQPAAEKLQPILEDYIG